MRPRYSPSVRRPRSAQTREKLLRAALVLFRERGFHGAGTNDIAAAAGLTGPSIYRHFATKEEILVAAVLEGARRLGDDAGAIDLEGDPLVALRQVCHTFAQLALEDPDLYFVYFYEARHVAPEAKVHLEERADRYLAAYERLLRKVRPDLSPQVVRLRVRAAVHLASGLCGEPYKPGRKKMVEILTDRMIVTLVGEPV